jgi:hypothetical protein
MFIINLTIKIILLLFIFFLIEYVIDYIKTIIRFSKSKSKHIGTTDGEWEREVYSTIKHLAIELKDMLFKKIEDIIFLFDNNDSEKKKHVHFAKEEIAYYSPVPPPSSPPPPL